MIATRQLCTFSLDGHLFGVDAQTVQEVIRYQEMTRVPNAPPAVRGLINLRKKKGEKERKKKGTRTKSNYAEAIFPLRQHYLLDFSIRNQAD